MSVIGVNNNCAIVLDAFCKSVQVSHNNKKILIIDVTMTFPAHGNISIQ